MDVSRREPHDEKTPAQVIELVLRNAGIDNPAALTDDLMDALVYKAYFEGAESSLRWLDPWPVTGEDYIIDRVLRRA